MPSDRSISILRLTALWGLAESGLGGWMHALHLPFTGIFVGGAAVVLISLISHFSNHDIKQVLQATLLVMLVKFTASPQTPWPAYIAVGFQGVMGAVLYRLVPHFGIASVLFSIITMLESALQKLLFMILLYGRSLWVALDDLFRSIVKMFSLSTTISFSYWLIWVYIMLYALWGLLLGIWITGLPHRIEANAEGIRKHFHDVVITEANDTGRKRKGNGFIIALILLFITGVFIAMGNSGRAVYVILRTLAALLLIFGIVTPLLNMLVTRWLTRSRSKHKEALASVLSLLPELRLLLKPAYSLASSRHTGLRKYPAFLLILITATLYPIHEPAADIHTDKPST